MSNSTVLADDIYLLSTIAQRFIHSFNNNLHVRSWPSRLPPHSIRSLNRCNACNIYISACLPRTTHTKVTCQPMNKVKLVGTLSSSYIGGYCHACQPAYNSYCHANLIKPLPYIPWHDRDDAWCPTMVRLIQFLQSYIWLISFIEIYHIRRAGQAGQTMHCMHPATVFILA